jgi:uncharacterized protein (TIGR02246 family)
MPSNLWTRLALIGLLPCLATVAKAVEQPTAETAAVRQAVSSFVKAFNSGDAKAMHDAWTETGDFINESGKRFRIKEMLLAEQKAGEKPTRKLTLEPEQVRLVTPAVATVDGFSIFQNGEHSPAQHGRFTATLVRKDDNWLFDSVRESAARVDSHHQHLAELAWMVGEWTGEHDGAQLHTKAAWSEDGNYLLRTFNFTAPDRGTLSGTQRIGWDPRAEVFRSWTFTHDGGYSVGTLKPIKGGLEADVWGVTAEGQATSHIARYLRVDANTTMYESVQATLEGDDVPDIKVELKRKPVAGK